MKLNESAPTQHLAILVLGGVIVFLNVIDSWKAKSRMDAANGNVQHYAMEVDEKTGQVTMHPSKYENPKLSWWDTLFCRGFQRSSNCSARLLHPMTNEADSVGIEVPEGDLKSNHVVYFRGTLNKNSALSGKLESPEAETPPARIADAAAQAPVPQ